MTSNVIVNEPKVKRAETGETQNIQLKIQKISSKINSNPKENSKAFPHPQIEHDNKKESDAQTDNDKKKNLILFLE